MGDLPVTATSLSPIWLKLTGRDRWIPTTALVYSCDWTGLENQVDSEVGFYNVIYSYSVGDERYAGKFSDYGMQNESYFHRGDTFTIRYDPSHPSRSYYPELRTRRKLVLTALGFGAGLALFVSLVTSLRGCGNS